VLLEVQQKVSDEALRINLEEANSIMCEFQALGRSGKYLGGEGTRIYIYIYIHTHI